MENWKDIDNYKGLYRVSDTGRVYSVRRKLMLRPGVVGIGYKQVVLKVRGNNKQYKVHRLVALAFCEKSPGCNIINHLNGDKLNNYASNLEWTTHSGNMLHAMETGLNNNRGENCNLSKFKKEKILKIKQMIKNGHRNIDIARKCEVSDGVVSSIKTGKTWRWLKILETGNTPEKKEG